MAEGKRKGKLVTVIVIAVLLLITIVVGHFVGGVPDDLFSDVGLRSGQTGDSSEFCVHFINVGQGDCTLFTCGDTAVLVDGGEYAQANTVVNYLKNQSVDDIDCLIATHPHSDHIGSLSSVITKFKVNSLIMPQLPEELVPTTSAYERFLKAVSANVKDVIPAKAGKSYTYGKLVIDVLSPGKTYDDLNNMSVVARISCGGASVMTTGDAGTTVEKDIIAAGYNLKSDILKVGHHGSRTSTGDKWLKAVDPDIAVISCGKNNDYGHPHKEVVNRLKKAGVEYRRTDLEGSIVYRYDGTDFTEVDVL